MPHSPTTAKPAPKHGSGWPSSSWTPCKSAGAKPPINIAGAGTSTQNTTAVTRAIQIFNNQAGTQLAGGSTNPTDAVLNLTGNYNALAGATNGINGANLDSLTINGVDADGAGGAAPSTYLTNAVSAFGDGRTSVLTVNALGTAAGLNGHL